MTILQHIAIRPYTSDKCVVIRSNCKREWSEREREKREGEKVTKRRLITLEIFENRPKTQTKNELGGGGLQKIVIAASRNVPGETLLMFSFCVLRRVCRCGGFGNKRDKLLCASPMVYFCGQQDVCVCETWLEVLANRVFGVFRSP